MGAVGEAGILVVNDDVVRITRSTRAELDEAAERERDTLERSVERIRSIRTRLPLGGCTAVIVDDGIATGASMLSAVRAVRAAQPALVVVAVPVGPSSACSQLSAEADDVVCATMPASFEAVGQVYADFHQVSDDEVREILGR